MTQDKELLLKDLCARLPYGVKMNHIANSDIEPKTLIGIAKNMITLEGNGGYETANIDEFTPYLFPLSSMTEEQRKELWDAFAAYIEVDFQGDLYLDNTTGYIHISEIQEYHNYLIKNHFDINNLIKRGFAIDATGLNIY